MLRYSPFEKRQRRCLRSLGGHRFAHALANLGTRGPGVNAPTGSCRWDRFASKAGRGNQQPAKLAHTPARAWPRRLKLLSK
jgi:hypothetical protein